MGTTFLQFLRTGTTFVTLSSMGNEVLPKWFKRNPFLIGKLVHPYHADVSVCRFRSPGGCFDFLL